MIDPQMAQAKAFADLKREVEELQRRVGRSALGAWQTLTLASGNWTLSRTPQWRTNGGRIELRGAIVRTTSTFGGGGTLVTLGGSNPPVPDQDYELTAMVRNTVTPGSFEWVVNDGGTLHSHANSPTLSIGAIVLLDGLWWPA